MLTCAEDVASSSFSETAAADMIKKAVEASILTPAKLSNRCAGLRSAVLPERASGERGRARRSVRISVIRSLATAA